MGADASGGMLVRAGQKVALIAREHHIGKRHKTCEIVFSLKCFSNSKAKSSPC